MLHAHTIQLYGLYFILCGFVSTVSKVRKETGDKRAGTVRVECGVMGIFSGHGKHMENEGGKKSNVLEKLELSRKIFITL